MTFSFQYPPSPSPSNLLPGGEFFKATPVVASATSAQGSRPPHPSPTTAVKQSQTDLTCQRIQEFETQASTDLELRNNKIDELIRGSEELRHQVSAQQKVCDV